MTQLPEEKRKEIEKIIELKLQEQGRAILNRNALEALFSASGDKTNALGKIFFGRYDALDAKRHELQQSEILNLLCKIDSAMINREINSINDLPSNILKDFDLVFKDMEKMDIGNIAVAGKVLFQGVHGAKIDSIHVGPIALVRALQFLNLNSSDGFMIY